MKKLFFENKFISKGSGSGGGKEKKTENRRGGRPNTKNFLEGGPLGFTIRVPKPALQRGDAKELGLRRVRKQWGKGVIPWQEEGSRGSRIVNKGKDYGKKQEKSRKVVAPRLQSGRKKGKRQKRKSEKKKGGGPTEVRTKA